MPLRESVAPGRRARQKQDFLLNIRCQVEEAHYLRYAGPRHVAEARQVGVVADRALADEAVEVDGQSHQAR